MHPLALSIILLTSLALLIVAVAVFRLPLGTLPSALGQSLEVIGAIVVFSIGNLALGLVLVLFLRKAGVHYFSLYEVADAALLVLSFAQALVFYAWRGARTRG